MSTEQAPYSRLERILARLDFAWRVSGSQLDYVAEHDLWMRRFRPGGPHALWIGGHLTFYEAGALRVYERQPAQALANWKDIFGNGSPCVDDAARYPGPEEVLDSLKRGREAIRTSIAGMRDEDLDRPVTNERLAIRDVQSQIEFLVWHDSHHAAQLGAIVNGFKQDSAA